MADLKAQIREQFPAVTFDEPLRLYSTFRIGGPADFFYKLKDKSELPALIKFAKTNQIPYLLIGGGSNILFHDQGFRGLIIKNEASQMALNKDKITADSGVRMPDLIRFSIEHNLSGLEKWTGLPGTVGGAVRGNAGCNGLETKEILIEATLYNPETDQTTTQPNSYFEYSYRESHLKHSPEIVLDATFQLQKAKITPEERDQIIAEINKFRISKQPPGLSSGSFFKNPTPEKPAGMLIDQAGLKGHAIGDAKISEKHGNFFMNTGSATFDNMTALAKLAKSQVKAKFGLDLHEEVQIIDQHGPTTIQ